ncbi:MAG TPA: hypothetical protein V6C58_13570 [Allocoleopsis sp.]
MTGVYKPYYSFASGACSSTITNQYSNIIFSGSGNITVLGGTGVSTTTINCPICYKKLSYNKEDDTYHCVNHDVKVSIG